jgi:hypothetical protein
MMVNFIAFPVTALLRDGGIIGIIAILDGLLLTDNEQLRDAKEITS